MQKFIFSIILGCCVLCSIPALASIPYYNKELGYTIWLADGWQEAPADYLSRFSGFHDGVEAHMAGWQAGYTLDNSTANLLVSELHGRVVSKTGISNFNRHVVRQLKKLSANPPEWSGKRGVSLTKASYDKGRNMLRLEMDSSDPTGKRMTTVVYIVYTDECMLKFVGLVEPGDVGGIAAIDKAVASLYLDRGLEH